jgi:hypothetical protein
MLKIKTLFPVLVVLLFLGLANTAFAQLSCSVASTPVSRATDTGLTEPAGDLIFNCIQGPNPTSAATMTITYGGLVITDATGYPAGVNAACAVSAGAVLAAFCNGGPIRIPAANTSGTLAAAGQSPSISNVSNASGSIIINVPAQAGAAGLPGSFTLSGVTLGIAGTGVTSVQANVSVSPGNNVLITAGQNNATVITSVLPGVVAAGVKATATGLVLTSGAEITGGSSTFKVNVSENYIDMFRSLSQFNGGATTQGVQLLFTFTGIPTGVTINGCVGSMAAAGGALTGTVTLSAASITSTTNTLTAEISGPAGPPGTAGVTNLTAIDTVTLQCAGAGNFVVGATATVPLTPGSITATVTLAPNGTALCPTQAGSVCATGTTGQIPRYTVNNLGPVTVLTIVSPTTHMLFPYSAIGNGFDTGFVVANTSTDPYGFTKGPVNTAGGANPVSGPVTLAFYPAGGSPFCVSTGAGAAAVAGVTSCTTLAATGSGSGLSSGGVVASGSSWVVLGSQLLSQVSGAPTSFVGYVFGIANFPYGHPVSFVADATFSGKFASGGPALVIPNPSIIARTGTGGLGFAVGLVESLGH